MFPPEYIKSESHDLGKDVCGLGWLDFFSTNQEGFQLQNKYLFFLLKTRIHRKTVSQRHKIQFASFYVAERPREEKSFYVASFYFNVDKIIVIDSELASRVDYESARPFISEGTFPQLYGGLSKMDKLILGLYVIEKRFFCD